MHVLHTWYRLMSGMVCIPGYRPFAAAAAAAAVGIRVHRSRLLRGRVSPLAAAVFITAAVVTSVCHTTLVSSSCCRLLQLQGV
jgi:multisubunit Na+/H+ antiporter MnhC subunit